VCVRASTRRHLHAIDATRRVLPHRFRGLLPGLIRSSIANGTSMVVYKKVHAELSRLAGRDDHSNI
jgi:hypothetical protein